MFMSEAKITNLGNLGNEINTPEGNKIKQLGRKINFKLKKRGKRILNIILPI